MASAPRPSGQASELPVDRREGIVERVHEQPAHEVDDEDAGAVARVSTMAAPRPGVPGG